MMNRGCLIGGLVLVAIAAVLVVLTVALPSGQQIFMVGEQNRPLVPAAVLGVLGVALVISAAGRSAR
jgi:hypothetical protein